MTATGGSLIFSHYPSTSRALPSNALTAGSLSTLRRQSATALTSSLSLSQARTATEGAPSLSHPRSAASSSSLTGAPSCSQTTQDDVISLSSSSNEEEDFNSSKVKAFVATLKKTNKKKRRHTARSCSGNNEDSDDLKGNAARRRWHANSSSEDDLSPNEFEPPKKNTKKAAKQNSTGESTRLSNRGRKRGSGNRGLTKPQLALALREAKATIAKLTAMGSTEATAGPSTSYEVDSLVFQVPEDDFGAMIGAEEEAEALPFAPVEAHIKETQKPAGVKGKTLTLSSAITSSSVNNNNISTLPNNNNSSGGGGGGGAASTAKGGGGGAASSRPGTAARRARGWGGAPSKDGMDLRYVTERMIALWVPGDVSRAAYLQGQQQAANMLRTKHQDNYMVFNLSAPRRSLRHHHHAVRELGWPRDLAPPLERLCAICKDMDSWLKGSARRIAVVHARGSKDRIGVVVAAYMHYSHICGGADQALDRFAMMRFLQDQVEDVEQPSHRRYVDYFSGLLSGSIKINSAPLYLTHVTVLGAPSFEPSPPDGPDPGGGGGGAVGGCRAFLKVYEGLVPVHTSAVYCAAEDARAFTVNVAAERGRRGLQLRGDVLVKCYHRHYSKKGDPNDPAHLKEAREIVFAAQFHTCAVSDYTLSFTRSELDYACDDLRFPLDGAVELHFSPTPEPRLPSPAPTPAVPTLDSSDDPVTRWDSYEHLGHLGGANASDDEDDDVLSEQDDALSHTYGPLDGSLYATVGRKQQLQQQEEHHRRMLLLQQQQDQHLQLQRARVQQQQMQQLQQAAGPSSELTISMDSGISSAGNGGGVPAAAPSSTSSQRALDDLLNDMLLTVESIPDLKPEPQHPRQARVDLQRTQRSGGEARYQRAPTAGGSAPLGPAGPTAAARRQSSQSHGPAQPAAPTASPLTPGQPGVHACPGNSDTLAALDDIPYHARLDGRPFTYVPGAANNTATPTATPTATATPMAPSVTPAGSNGLSSPSLVRRASGRAVNGYATSTPHHANGTNGTNGTPSWTSPRDQQRFQQDDLLSDGPGSRSHLTWLQRQQQKLRERREGLVRSARQPHEARLLSELRSLHHAHSASRRLDGYTSDTTMFADEDEEDLCRPLHINTSAKLNGAAGGMSAPGSPLQRRAAPYTNAAQPYGLSRQKSDSSFDRERPFVAVKRGYEQRAKYHDSPDNSPVHAAAYDRTALPNRLNGNYSNYPCSYANGVNASDAVDASNASHYSTPRPAAVPVHWTPSTPTPTPLTCSVARTLFSPRGAANHANHANHAVNGVGNGKHGVHSGPPSPEDALLLMSSPPPSGGSAREGLSNGGHSGGGLTNGGLSNGRLVNGGLANGGLSNGGLSNGGLSNRVLHQDALACLMASLASPSNSPNSASTASPTSMTPSMTPSPPAAFAGATSPTSPASSMSPTSHYLQHQHQHHPARHCNASECSTNSTASFAWQSSQLQHAAQREDSYSSWRSEDDRFSRPQTPAFPVQPRTPYYNGHQFDSTGLPPKSPTTQRKDRSPSPMSDHQGHGIYMQHSPKSPSNGGGGGQSSPSVYSTRRSSTHSNSEPPQEVAAHHVKFVRDTSRYWYKPNISREEAIAVLREAPPGTFVVRDSNSFPGAFGLALKVAVPPATVAQKAAFFSGDASELVRHFLIEPTSRGVKLKGCTNEPVFSSLSALVYQHSIMAMALPCKLLLPDGEIGAASPSSGSGTLQARHVGDLGSSPSGASHSVNSAHQLLAQGAACNVLYLLTTDTESLTGPQAIRRAVQTLFTSRPLPSATVVHFKVSSQGITLTDNKRRLFFRRHYPVSTISHCGLDPDDHRWCQKSPDTGMPISSNRCFGFVARKPASRSDNQCHIFAELEPEQPANAIVNFVSKVMMSGVGQKNVV